MIENYRRYYSLDPPIQLKDPTLNQSLRHSILMPFLCMFIVVWSKASAFPHTDEYKKYACMFKAAKKDTYKEAHIDGPIKAQFCHPLGSEYAG